MRRKNLHLLLTILSLIVSCTIILLFMGCWFMNAIDRARGTEVDPPNPPGGLEEENMAKEEEQIEEEAVEEEPAEEIAPAEDTATTEKTFPSEPISYTGIANGAEVILIVDFETKEVTGSISLAGDDYINATITDGKIKIDTLEIDTKYSGTGRLKAEGEDYPVSGTITGKISDDLSTFKGTILPDVEGATGTEFTASK